MDKAAIRQLNALLRIDSIIRLQAISRTFCAKDHGCMHHNHDRTKKPAHPMDGRSFFYSAFKIPLYAA
jgi:hypothetical protein